MILTCFITNVYQLAVSRGIISLLRPQEARIVYCAEFINHNNPFLRYLGQVPGVRLLPVSESGHKPCARRLARNAAPQDAAVRKAVMDSDQVFFGDPYLLSQRSYVGLAKAVALIEDSPTLFSYYRFRKELSPARRWLAELLGQHPWFAPATPCYGFSTKNNCQSSEYVNLWQALGSEAMEVLKAEIRRAFRAEFETLELIASENDENTFLLLTQPLASDGIVASIDRQVDLYIGHIAHLQANGFRVFCKMHPRDIANGVHYPVTPDKIFHFSSPMELFEDELRKAFVGIAAYNSYSFVESTRFARLNLSL